MEYQGFKKESCHFERNVGLF